MAFLSMFRDQPAKTAPLKPANVHKPSAPPASSGSAMSAAAPIEAVPAEPIPTELSAFLWLTEQDLDPARKDALLSSIRNIPRPPRSMEKLLSPDFVANASSTELGDLVMGEPLIAGKVLSTVNAPFYGLRTPVTNIGQAVTFLGMNAVRNICLQYMLQESFKPKDAGVQKCFDGIWCASAIASDLCVRLSKKLNLPDQGSLSTQVVLSFVGDLATATLIPASELRSWAYSGRLERAGLEQKLLGLNSSEIGCLLMKHWELPASLINDVSSVSRQLVTSYMTSDPVNAPRLALGYLCARLGDRLTLGQLDSLEGYDVKQDDGVDTFHLRAALAHPTLARLEQALAAPDLEAAVQKMLGKPAA